MVLLSLAVWKTSPNTASIRLAQALNLNSFSILTRGSVREQLTFASRTVAARTEIGTRQSVFLKDVPYLVHAYTRFDGLCGIAITDEDYPARVAFALISQTLEKFTEKVGEKWKRITKDQEVEPVFMKDDLNTFQDPNNDKMNKIKTELDEVKDVMHKNIDEVLKRGETLDDLMDKSEDVSALSKEFYRKAKKTNSCC